MNQYYYARHESHYLSPEFFQDPQDQKKFTDFLYVQIWIVVSENFHNAYLLYMNKNGIVGARVESFDLKIIKKFGMNSVSQLELCQWTPISEEEFQRGKERVMGHL